MWPAASHFEESAAASVTIGRSWASTECATRKTASRTPLSHFTLVRPLLPGNVQKETFLAQKCNRGPLQRPPKYDGSRTSRIVRKPDGDASTAGIAFTAIDAVAMSPCTPPSIFEYRRGTPSIRTES